MNHRFRSYVTDIAFRLTLGKSHITALVAMKQGQVYKDRIREADPPGTKNQKFLGDSPLIMFEMGIWVPAVNALIARGLVEYTEDNGVGFSNPKRPKFWQRYRFTPAGELAWKMLVEAGLIEEIVLPKRQLKQPRQRKAA